MLLCFAALVHATDASSTPASPVIESPAGDRTVFIDDRQAAIITAANVLGKLQERQQWLIFLQNASTVTDYICQTMQIVLTIPQLAGHPSEEQGVWLNSFNLAAGIIALSQIPTKKWLHARLTEIQEEIARLQTANS
jgi:hypothetical protein